MSPEMSRPPTRRQDLGSPIRRSRARSVALRLVLAALIGATVACGSVALPAPAQQEGASSSDPLAGPDAPEAAEVPQEPPNVLVIETDDMRWDDLRWMPNVRRLLQRRGLSFENSFGPFPLCCPSRSSFPERPVHTQPPRLHPPRALRLHGVPGPALDRHGPAARGVPHGPGRQVPQRLRRAVPALGWELTALRAAGLGSVVRRLGPPVELRRSELRRRDVLLRPSGAGTSTGRSGPSPVATPPTWSPSRRAV